MLFGVHGGHGFAALEAASPWFQFALWLRLIAFLSLLCMAHPVHRPIAVRVRHRPITALPWLLASTIVAWVLNARLGGNAVVWHFRVGPVLPTRHGFRTLWGMIGGRWARFASFIHGSGKVLRCLNGQSRADQLHELGHSPPGGLSVCMLLGFLALRVASLGAE